MSTLQNRQQKIQSMVTECDAFGTTPKLFINNKTKYKTAFGSLLSFILLGIVVVACWIYGKDMHFRENPNSIFTEESTTHPEKFKINKDTMNFSFGLQDANWVHFIDETIYKVIFEQYTMITNQDGSIDVQITDLKARRCKKEDFGIAVEYFHNLAWLEDLYCIDNYDLANMEGDYGAQVFSAIQGRVLPCRNNTDIESGPIISDCKPQEEIDSMLKDNYWALYTSDSVISPKNYKDPYEPVGRNVYGFSSGQMFKQLDFNFRNVYLEDNTGIIFDSFSKRRGIQFTNADKFIKTEPLENGQFLQFLIRFEKVKQTRIYRTYLNLAQVLANVGGILKVCMLAFMVVSGFVAEQFYNVNVVNSLFNFEYEYEGKINSEEHQNQRKGKLFFSSVFNVFFGFCSRKHVKSQKKMLNYSVRKLGYHLDIKRILQKLIEIDKLKMLLLDEQQIKLFEYLPKPTINEQMCIKSEQNQKNKENNTVKKQSKDFENPEEIKDNKHINLLFEDTRTSEDKAKEAFEAFKKINFATRKGKIDRKIIEIMDIKLKNEFESKLEKQVQDNQIDITIYQKDRSSIYQIQQHDLTHIKLLHKQELSKKDAIADPESSLQTNNNSQEKNKSQHFQDQDFIVQEEYNKSYQNFDDTLFGDPTSYQDIPYSGSPVLSPQKYKQKLNIPKTQQSQQQQQLIQQGPMLYLPINLSQIQQQILNSLQQPQKQIQKRNKHQLQKPATLLASNPSPTQKKKINSMSNIDCVVLPSNKTPQLKLKTSKFDTKRDRGSSTTSSDMQNNFQPMNKNKKVSIELSQQSNLFVKKNNYQQQKSYSDDNNDTNQQIKSNRNYDQSRENLDFQTPVISTNRDILNNDQKKNIQNLNDD